jgi:hypothetical protein
VPCDVHHRCLTFAREGARLVGLGYVLDLMTGRGYSSYARVVRIASLSGSTVRVNVAA